MLAPEKISYGDVEKRPRMCGEPEAVLPAGRGSEKWFRPGRTIFLVVFAWEQHYLAMLKNGQGAFEELESVFGGAIIFMVYRSLWSINPCGRGVYSFHIAGMVVRPERAHSRGVHSFSARRGGVFI